MFWLSPGSATPDTTRTSTAISHSAPTGRIFFVSNTRKIQRGNDLDDVLTASEIVHVRARMAATCTDASQLSDADIQAIAAERARRFREEAPMTAAAAATVILSGVKEERWRILVGHDAHRLDALVRQTPEAAYDDDFFRDFATEVGWRL